MIKNTKFTVHEFQTVTTKFKSRKMFFVDSRKAIANDSLKQLVTAIMNLPIEFAIVSTLIIFLSLHLQSDVRLVIS